MPEASNDNTEAAADAARRPAASPVPAKAAASNGETASVQLPTLAEKARPAQQPLTVATEEERNQSIAEDWPKPFAALVLTGRQHGYIEPCGCTGLENQKGGLNRRDTLITELRRRDWPVLPIDAGNQVRRYGQQAELKFGHTTEALKLMKYAAVGLGPDDLQLSSTPLLLNMTDLEGKFQSPYVSANVSVITPEAPEKLKLIDVEGHRLGITAVLGKEAASDVQNAEIQIADPAESLRPVVTAMDKAKCDFRILIVNGSLEESRQIAQQVPEFDLLVTAGGHGEPLYKPEQIAGTKTQMIQVGVKGMYAGLVGLYENEAEPLRYQRISLSSQFTDSPRMMDLFAEYQKALKNKGFGGLGLKPLSHPTGRQFVGSAACGECHTTAFGIWENTPHAHATESIVHPPERSEVTRIFDPECVSCHVTGWNPQQYYPYLGGFLSLENTPAMTANGCENCHGPGSRHVAFENGELEGDEALRDSLRAEMRLPLEKARDKCIECHDMDNSPDFHHDGAFEEYWEQVAHYGKD